MKPIRILTILLLTTLFVAACGSDDEPYITFKNANDEVLTSPVTVASGSRYELFINTGFEEARGEHNLIHYERRIGDGRITDLAFSGTLHILAVGAFNNLNIERARIDLTFNEETMPPGSRVTIIVRDNGMLRNTQVFEVR